MAVSQVEGLAEAAKTATANLESLADIFDGIFLFLFHVELAVIREFGRPSSAFLKRTDATLSHRRATLSIEAQDAAEVERTIRAAEYRSKISGN